MGRLVSFLSIGVLFCIVSGCSLSRPYKQVDGDGHAVYRFKVVSSVVVKDSLGECSGRVKKLSSGPEAQTQTVKLRCSDGRKGQLTMEVRRYEPFPEAIEGSFACERVSFVLSEADCVIWPKDFSCG